MATESPPLIYNEENGVYLFSRLLLIRSFLYLQVTRTCIQSRTSSNFSQIGPLTTESVALELLKNPHRLIMGKWWLHASSFIFDWLIINVAGNQDRHKSSILGRIRLLILEVFALEWRNFNTFELEYLWSQKGSGKGCIWFWGRLDQISGFHGNRKPPPPPHTHILTYNGENNVSTFSVLFLTRYFWKDHIWHWHIGLRWAMVAVWAACFLFRRTFHFRVMPLLRRFFSDFPIVSLWNLVNKVSRELREVGSWYLAHRLCPMSRWPD